MKYLQRLGKSLMIPVAALPIGGILMGISYWMTSEGRPATAFTIIMATAGGILIENMALLFAVAIAYGMTKDNDGTAALSGVISFLTITTMLSIKTVTAIFGTLTPGQIGAFTQINNQFIGILCGLIAATCYNRFSKSKLPGFLSFFAGKRSVALVTVVASLLACIPLFFAWPVLYSWLVALGEGIVSLGAVGAGIYGFLNRLLIPIGLHHALNSVFWFGVAGIDDIGKFAGLIPGGVLGETGMYMSGFFPVMMFGLPGAALAMYHTAKTNKKKIASGLLFSAALCSFFIGITEPLEFAFMFLAPALYVVHAVLTGIVMFVVALLPARSGFQFSAGFVDWFISLKSPMELNSWILLIVGLAVGVLYYVVFRVLITKFNFKTPGREDDETEETTVKLASNDFTAIAAKVLEGLGGKDNVTALDNCITRLRLEIKDYTKVNDKVIKSAGVAGVIRPSKTSVQVIVGTQVQYVADEMKKML